MEKPIDIIREARHLTLPKHHDVSYIRYQFKAPGISYDYSTRKRVSTFDDLLLTTGLGPRTLQSLTLVSEVIYGTPSRFSDPAGFPLLMVVKMAILFLYL